MTTQPSFKQANKFLRQGLYTEALDMFAALVELRPGFLPYEQGYALAKLRFSESIPECVVHPESKSIKMVHHRLFSVVTPVLNGESFIAQTIESILSQKGDFFIDYFVKDAGSTDQTMKVVEQFLGRVMTGEYPLGCSGIRFRVESRPDNGLYDALRYAFDTEPWRQDSENNIQTYLNADDLMHPDTFRTVLHVFDVTSARWVCGQTHVIDKDGGLIVAPEFPLTYAREDMASGYHDGRSLYTVQQEGTFWLQELYQYVGGIDSRFKLAGDFDLWRRFALQCELLALDRPLASFRNHQKQLSKQILQYQLEVDNSISEASTDEYPSAQCLPFYIGTKAPKKGPEQRPGPIGFLDSNGRLLEIAYVKRAWYSW